MYKYIVTEQNIHAIAGNIKKFFDSCSKCGMYDYSTSCKNINKKNYYDSEYLSYPSSKNISVIFNQYRNQKAIRFIYPVKRDINIGDKVIFIGGNKIVTIKSLIDQYGCNQKDYSKFKDVYKRITHHYYDVCD